MMESSAKTSSSSSPTSSHLHLLLPNSNWIHQSSPGVPMFCPGTTAFAFNLNDNDDDEKIELRVEDEIPKLSLFEKPLTPSDVGKLNRLVIPKQHAEKYFPLNGAGDSGMLLGFDSGMLLGFEDEAGKSWRFRYSYWNSSQSYVLTKGWSRFVKEKHLDAGDVVVFARHPSESERFFIGWRRRNAAGGGEDGGNLNLPATIDGGWNSDRGIYSANSNNRWNQQQILTSLHHHHRHNPQHFSLQSAGTVN